MNRNVICLALVLVAGAWLAMAADQGPLVLADGTSLEVAKTQVEGSLVYAIFANGAMQAYPIEDVDLAASGLLPEPKTEPVAPKRAPSIADAQATSSGTGLTITDSDVSHVVPSTADDEVEEEADKGPKSAALLIGGFEWQAEGGMVNANGKVINSGSKGMSAIMLTVTAYSNGEEVGSGTTSISQELKPKTDVSFALSFPADGMVDDVAVRAQAAMTDFSFKAKPAPAPSAG